LLGICNLAEDFGDRAIVGMGQVAPILLASAEPHFGHRVCVLGCRAIEANQTVSTATSGSRPIKSVGFLV